MQKEISHTELELLAQTITDLDRMRFEEGIDPQGRLELEKRIVALRATESEIICRQTQEQILQIEKEVQALKELRTAFENKWKNLSATQSVLDKINQVMHSLLSVIDSAKKI